jgi:RNA polymerase sigma factor (TIGR02999 family)
MTAEHQRDLTEVLGQMRAGEPGAADRLVPLVYGELHRMAHRRLADEPTGHTLSTTALVHEAYLKLVDQARAGWEDRAHFFAVAARAMRQILVDYARRHHAARRGGPAQRQVALDDRAALGVATAARADELLALDEALERLEAVDPRLARIVECRFFVGLTEPETAEALGVSQRTVARGWMTARGWLYEELRGDGA